MLAGLVNKERGWGRGGETWSAMETLGALGGPTWFQPGDRDLALQLARTAMPAAGQSLTQATQTLTSGLGVAHRLLPTCEQPVAAVLDTSEDLLEFQRYFVRRRCEPKVRACRFVGAGEATITEPWPRRSPRRASRASSSSRPTRSSASHRSSPSPACAS